MRDNKSDGYEDNPPSIKYYPTRSINSHDTESNNSRTGDRPFVKLNCSIVKSALVLCGRSRAVFFIQARDRPLTNTYPTST